MKNFINFLILTIFAFSIDLWAGTCTSISRTNNSANSVLTSTKYNLDNNTAYTAINAADGGCITSGTLEKDSLNTTDFSVIQSAPKTGCKVSYSTASQLLVGPCRIAIDNDFTTTTTGSTVAFGCSGCSGETGTTDFYLYGTTSSATSSLDLLISTSVPDSNGYSGTSRALGKFFNDSSSNIDPISIMQFRENNFVGDTFGAGLIGSVKWAETTNCQWSSNSATMADFAADTDCDDTARSIKGAAILRSKPSVGHVDGRQPYISFNSLPAGIYLFVANGMFYSGDGASNRCAYRFSDGTVTSSKVNIGQATSNHYAPTISGLMIYTADQGAITISIQSSLEAGSACYIDSGASETGLEILAFRFPLVY